MARVRVCKFCGHKNAADELFCQGQSGSADCGVSVTGFPLVEESEIDSSHSDEGTRDPGFDGTVREVSGEVRDELAHLVCPWGLLPFVGSLSVGRDPGLCPEAEHFASFMTVSGIHARICCADENWFVRDLGSTNGTYLNGVQVNADEDVSLSDGDQVHFSRSFRAVFRIGGA